MNQDKPTRTTAGRGGAFLRLTYLSEAVGLLLENASSPSRLETVSIAEAAGRVLAEDVVSPEDVPGFDRSQMDGFAVRAADTFGAGEGLPAYLDLIGEVMMASESGLSVGAGQAARISTGGFMPEGTDAVVMVENTELSGLTVEVVKAVAPGENVVARDEDIAAGTVLLARGLALRAAHVGALAAVGVETVIVFRRPVVGIISTGDEVVPAGTRPGPGQVRDVNTPALASAVREARCEPRSYGVVSDDLEKLTAAARAALAECDALLMSGGSSAGVRDMTQEVLSSLGEPGVLAHGIYLKPGKPTLLAACSGKPVVGLPGNPASALTVFREVVLPVLSRLRGEGPSPEAVARRTVEAVMERSVASAAGRLELVPVALKTGEDGMAAMPVLGKTSLIGTLARADGQVRIPEGREGLEQGERVTVELFD